MVKNKEIVLAENQIFQEVPGYKNLLHELKSILSQGQAKAYKAVDNIKVQTYWQLGERIVREELQNKDRANYGQYLIEYISIDLDIQRQRLYEIVKFYRCYEIVRTVSGQLSWNHYLELIKIDTENQRLFYQDKAIINSWSVRELRTQIKNQLYENTTPEEIQEVFHKTLPEVNKLEIFKGTYDLGFTGMQNNEKDLENKLIIHIEAFLKELGDDFCFVGRQVPIKIDGVAHFIDVVLYHRGIPCPILVDLKINKLDSRDVGQMNKYVNYYRKNRQYAHEKEAIGLIICNEAGREEILYALGGLEEKIFIATYKTKLPSEEKIKKALINIEENQ